uniref:fluoride efflux transporter FluC n=1 Tax=Candidatus Planktophila sp. TaxID=2175601 RepID=UPI004049BB6F
MQQEVGLTLKAVALVSLGGTLGSLLRWLVIENVPSEAFGVFVVNQLGVLVAGTVAYKLALSESRRTFWISGFAGGFTTMSSLAFLMQSSSVLYGFFYGLLSLLCSIAILKLLNRKAPA